MILWVFFTGGAGGDGFANLLEQSLNVVPVDGIKTWRIHRYVDNQAKFWAPNLQNTASRINTTDQLTDQQCEIANSNHQYLVITSHDVQLMHTFVNPNIDHDKHIKILLTMTNHFDQLIAVNLKNLIEFDQTLIYDTVNNNANQPTLDLSGEVCLDQFDYHFCSPLRDWTEIKKLVDDLGLLLTLDDFEHYKKIVTGQLICHTTGIECYESFVDQNNITKYNRVF